MTIVPSAEPNAEPSAAPEVKAVPETVTAAFDRLPQVMARADTLAGRIEAAVLDLAEAVVLKDAEGQVLRAVVTETDERGARIQLTDHPVVARLPAYHAAPGDEVRVRLVEVDPARRRISFNPA